MASFKRKKIYIEETVGGKLRSIRRKKKISLEKVEEETKIRLKYLQAIESDNFRSLPSRVYVIGFIRRYSDYLGINPDESVREYKQAFGRSPKATSFAFKSAFATKNRLVVTPKLLVTISAVLLVLAVVIYLAISIARFSKPPVIDIIAPQQTTVEQKDLVIEGKTSDNASIEINNQTVNVDESGNFSQKVELTLGVNIFQIDAKSRIGKQSSKIIKVLYGALPSQTPTK